MPKIILKDGSEFIVDQSILEENILPAQPDEMIQLGKNYFKKSSIEIIHGDDDHESEYADTPNEDNRGKHNWTEFTGLPNSNQILTQKAKALSVVVYKNMLSETKSIKENTFLKEDIKNIVKPEEGVLKGEILICLLHLIDRESCSFFKSDLDKRNLFMEALIEESFLLLLKDLEIEDNQENRIRSLKKLYYIRDSDYAKCKYMLCSGIGSIHDSLLGAMSIVLASHYDQSKALAFKILLFITISFPLIIEWCNTTDLLTESV